MAELVRHLSTRGLGGSRGLQDPGQGQGRWAMGPGVGGDRGALFYSGLSAEDKP